MPACGSCETENPEVARFCLACGAPLSRACPQCQAVNPGSAQFCMGCGSSLANAPAPPVAAEPAAAHKPAPRDERRPITAVFVDIVGSTSRAEQLDPEDVLALLAPYYVRLRRVLERHGGVVEKFIGDAVVAVFGAPVAHGDDPERAVRAGLGILAAIDELNEDDPSRQLEVRIGITTGEAIVSLDSRLDEGRGMAWGDVLNTAARLQSAAPVNGLIVDERTYRACASAIEFSEADPVTAKGKAAPVPVWEAAGLRDVDRRGAAESPLVGREAELECLESLWRGVLESGASALAILIGEPGLGKTRLLSEVASRADGADVHWGGCLSYGEGITYWPVTQIVKAAAEILASDSNDLTSAKVDALIDRLPTDDVDQLRTIASALSNLVGAPTTPRGTYVTTDISQAELHWGIRRVCELLAALQPLVLVFEDLHWAEPTLVELLESLLTLDAPILILASARPELADAHPQLILPDMRKTVLRLDALSAEDSEALVAGIVERLVEEGLDRATLERLVRNAGGNPLFLEETVQMVLDAGPIDAAGLESLPMPETLQALVAARLDSLPPAERQLIQHASVAGVTFWSGAAARLDDREGPPDELLGSLERRTIVHEHATSEVAGEREWEFKHMVIRDVAYGRLPKGRRVGLHVRFADWISELPEGGEEFLEILAYHLERSCTLARDVGHTDVPPPVARAVAALQRAGEKAERRGGLREAHGFYARALALEPPDRGTVTELRLHRARTLVELGDNQQAAKELEEVIQSSEVTGQDRIRCDATLTLGTIAMKQGRADNGRRLVAEAEDLATRLGDTRLATRAAFELAWWDAWFTGEIDTPVERLEQALARAESERELTLRIGGLLRLGMLLVNVARLADAEEHLTLCTDLAGELGSVRDAARATHILGLIKYYRGELDSAEQLLVQADDWLERTGDRLFEIQNLRALALHARTLDLDDLVEARLRRALPLASEFGGYFAVEIARLLVECLLRSGKLDEARAVAEPAVAAAPDEDATARATALMTTGAIAAAAGTPDVVRPAFDEAIAALQGVQAWIDVGEAQLAYADALTRLADEEGARRELARAGDTFASIGATGLLGVVDERLEALASSERAAAER